MLADILNTLLIKPIYFRTKNVKFNQMRPTFLVLKYFSSIQSVYVHNARKHPTKSVF